MCGEPRTHRPWLRAEVLEKELRSELGEIVGKKSGSD